MNNKVKNFKQFVNEELVTNRKLGLSQFNKLFKNAKIVRDGDILKISKIDDPVNFLEIYQQKDYKKTPVEKIEGSFGINIVSGTIENPSKSGNARWYNFGDKYYDLKGVLDVAKRYGIE